MFGDYWYPVRDGDQSARGLFVRHYSASLKHAPIVHARGNDEKFCGPGQHMVLLGRDYQALFVWRLQSYRNDGQQGVDCSVFRNEGHMLSSELIREADALADERWPGVPRHFTFVDSRQTHRRRSRQAQPGQCFIHAGWQPCGTTVKLGLNILERVA